MTPEEEEQVRRTLASLPSPGAMPPEVAARLEAEVADLVAERDSAPRDSDRLSETAASRWRRRWPAALVAAALVAVVGVGLGTLLDDITGGGMDAQEAESGTVANRELSEGGDAAPEAGPEAGGDGAEAPNRQLLTAKRIRVSSETLRQDVSEIVDLHIPRAAAVEDPAAAPESDRATEEYRRNELFSPCDPPASGSGDRLVAVRLDGRPATLVLRKPADGMRVAEIYSCDNPDALLARTEVSAR